MIELVVLLTLIQVVPRIIIFGLLIDDNGPKYARVIKFMCTSSLMYGLLYLSILVTLQYCVNQWNVNWIGYALWPIAVFTILNYALPFDIYI